MSDQAEMSFTDHLTELRKRVFLSLIGLCLGFVAVYLVSEQVFGWLLIPLCGAFQDDECRLITTGVAEAFLVYLKTGLLGGVFVAAPWIFYQLWCFVRPGLLPHEQKLVVPFVGSASFMFIGGAVFGYFLVFPIAFEFLLSIASGPITPMPAMAQYFTFASTLLLAFGLLFEIPVLVVLFTWLGVVSSESLWRTWRYAVIGIFVLAALLTPADPFTLILLATPLSILYIGALLICSLIDRSRSRQEETNSEEES